jgi:Ca-activated chloride channel homolog
VLPASGPKPVLDRIGSYASSVTAQGNTAIYTSLRSAYRLAQRWRTGSSERPTSIVLMSDGENNRGIGYARFAAFHRHELRPAAREVPTFVILYGDARKAEMAQIAELTGGETFDARSASLPEMFQIIRGYQ